MSFEELKREAELQIKYVAKTDVPEDEDQMFKMAYESALADDVLMAHSFRLRKSWREFSTEDWKSVIDISGEDAVKTNIAAFVACLSNGLFKDSF